MTSSREEWIRKLYFVGELFKLSHLIIYHYSVHINKKESLDIASSGQGTFKYNKLKTIYRVTPSLDAYAAQ